MSKAFIDTTVLTDFLLKSGAVREAARRAIAGFSHTSIPVYAIKEFKAGPFRNFIWMHNKLASSKSYSVALDALHRMSRTPKKYTTSTAIEALRDASGSIGKKTSQEVLSKYGPNESLDQIYCDELRLVLKTVIFKAWSKRRAVTDEVVAPLLCYREVKPSERRGLIEIGKTTCEKNEPCSILSYIRENLSSANLVKDSLKGSDKLESQRRHKVLREVCRKSNYLLDEKECRYLGDAVFVLLAPDDSSILTTNISDFKTMADAVGKKVVTPEDL